MAKSDHSDGDEEVSMEMPPLEISSESIDKPTNGKRGREESSEKEITSKKRIRKSDNSKIEDEDDSITSEDNREEEKKKEEEMLSQDEHSSSLEDKTPNESTNKDTDVTEESFENANTSLNEEKKQEDKKREEKKDQEKEAQKREEEKTQKEEKNGQEDQKKRKEEKEEMNRKTIETSNNKDTEVVEGLELSVECASDKDSTSESDKEVEKPRKKTTIVKAKPNDSELDISSSEAEQSIEEESTENTDGRKGAKRGRKRALKKDSESESKEGEEGEEEDREKSRNKSKGKGRARRSAKLAVESRKNRGGKKSAAKKRKNYEAKSEDEETSDIEPDKSTVESKEKSDENLSDKESVDSSSSGSEDDDDDEDGKGRKRGSGADGDKRIQSLKKYIRAAGIKVKSYQEIWTGCKSNAAKARKLKSLLEQHGITGRPTLEKCKKVKERNERLKEVSELDKSNIISEGRVTRARRGMDANKNSIVSSDTFPRERETRNTYKRLRTVADSDSE